MNAQNQDAIPWTKLPFTFDPAGLHSDIAAIQEAAWIPHFNQADYAGEWSSVSLRSRGGSANDIIPSGDVSEFQDTPLLAACPHLRAAIEAFHFPMKSIRLLRLHAGSRVKEHADRDLGLADGELRIHIPVVTSEQVEFVVANRRLRLREGEAWFIDFSQPHRIDNAGTDHRVHLVIDGVVNEWALALLQRSVAEIVTETSVPAGMVELQRFRELVYQDHALQAELMKETYPEDLMDAVLAAGTQRGYGFKRGDVESLYRLNMWGWAKKSAAL